jgi:formate hydrogenlyase subunit 3/multisubunit Na+/H+ antiporter MnhD subunit
MAALISPAAWRARSVGIIWSLSGVAITAAGLAAVMSAPWRLRLPELLPLAGLEFATDALTGWFLLLIGAVTAVVGLYAVGYVGRDGRGSSARRALALLPLFTFAMVLVTIAASVPTLLMTWELMAVASLLLVLTDHQRRPEVRSATVWYAALTQAGFVALLIGLVRLSAVVGAVSFTDIRAVAPGQPATVTSGVFLLCLVGFASKAGAVPLHPWLPRAHAEAPSHVSALMSAAMVKLGVYGIVRVGFDLLGGGPRWWWLVVACLGALSALYGIMQAAVARDIKRLLAFSTSENIGLILIGIGFAGMLVRSGGAAAALAMTAALLHTANHAGFKTLLFAAAGSVVRATGTRDLDLWGGLARRMPATTALFSIGAIAAAALPPGNGFISEWLLLQALLRAGPAGDTLLTVAAPAAVAAVALTAGVGVATFVKAVGAGLLARPRSDDAARAVEAPGSMLTAMAVAAAGCAVLAVVPTITVPALSRVVTGLTGGPASISRDALGLRLAGFTAGIWPLWIAVGLVIITAAVAVGARGLGRARRRSAAWDCGDGPLTARMEYTATSFAEPLQRVFDDVLAPERDIDVTHDAESAYHVEAVRYHLRIPDRIENRLYRPVIAAIDRLGRAGSRLATGSVHRYLAYMFAALVIVLLAVVIQ